jgi:chaperone modulatory protein CbpM
MNTETTEIQWLHAHAEVSWDELIELSGLSADLLRELVDYGVLAPLNARAPDEDRPAQWRFAADCVVAVRTVSRLREDFELDANALSVALTLIERIHELEAQLQALQSQFPRPKGR